MSTSYAPPVQRLVTELSKLPGVGSRTAQRLAFHLLCGPARLTLFVASPLTSLALDTASYVFRFAFYAVFVHLQPSR